MGQAVGHGHPSVEQSHSRDGATCLLRVVGPEEGVVCVCVHMQVLFHPGSKT